MHYGVQVKVHKETAQGTLFYVLAPGISLTDEVLKISLDGLAEGELRIDDGRTISAEQRKKAYATMADIANHTGYMPEELKEIMKYYFIAKTGEKYFSLSDCSITTARHFINYILDFALSWGIPLNDDLINRADDINAAIHSSLKHRRCAVCGRDGEVHHVDTIGAAGGNYTTFDDSKLRKICLCREHHTEAHKIGMKEFEARYCVYGIVFRE